jgi:hypothetical protein
MAVEVSKGKAARPTMCEPITMGVAPNPSSFGGFHMSDFAKRFLPTADSAFTHRGQPRRCQIASKITMRATLMTVSVSLLALSSPLAHSQGGIGLPFSAGNDPTKWVPFPNVSQPETATVKQQRPQCGECSSADDNKATAAHSDKKAEIRMLRQSKTGVTPFDR